MQEKLENISRKKEEKEENISTLWFKGLPSLFVFILSFSFFCLWKKEWKFIERLFQVQKPSPSMKFSLIDYFLDHCVIH